MFPIKYIDNNLVWNKDNEVFAYSKFQRAMMLIQGCSLISKLDDLPF